MENETNIILTANPVDEGNPVDVKIPVECSIRLIKRGTRGLRAVAKLSYGGVTINDILVYERRGELKIRYPFKNVKRRTGESYETTIVFPNNNILGSQFNHIIQQAYSKAMLEEGNPILQVIDNEIVESENTQDEAA